MAAAYQCDISMTDDETFLFNVSLKDAEGNPPTWGDYAYEYALTGNGVTLLLTEGDGVTVDEINDLLTIGPADRTYRLPAGTYSHGLRGTLASSNITTQYFDGTVTVTEGNFA